MTVSFTSLGVDRTLVTALARRGIDIPFPIQALTIPDALAGRDVCGQASTGSGKTLAFSVPLVQHLDGRSALSPRGLVLVPTRELAVQVLEVLRPLARAAGLKVTAIYGGVSPEGQRQAARTGIDIVVATPGRLNDLVEQGAVDIGDVEVAVIDEADRMADMGFLPQVERILRRFRRAKPQFLLFSATLDGAVGRLIRNHLTDPMHHEVPSETPTVAEMSHRFLAVHQMDRVKVAAAIAHSTYRTLVFVRTKRGADRLVAQLAKEGVKTAAIHGDLRQSARERALKGFAAGKLQVLVATDVVARGIHVDDIDVVIHFDPPEDHKAYLHRSGRTARAGRGGVVATFVLWDQIVEVDRMRKVLRITDPVIEVFSNDPRLANLETLAPVAVAAS